MDKFNLDRFLDGQRFGYETALQEIRNGKKENHWIWYIFPQLKGLGKSPNSNYYGITGMEEAKAYLEHPVLGARLREACTALLEQSPLTVQDMFQGVDILKLCSSMTLFDAACPDDLFGNVLKEFFDNRKDPITMRMLGESICQVSAGLQTKCGQYREQIQ